MAPKKRINYKIIDIVLLEDEIIDTAISPPRLNNNI